MQDLNRPSSVTLQKKEGGPFSLKSRYFLPWVKPQPEVGLWGLVLLQRWDVQRGRGPPAPFLQLPVLEEEVDGGQGDAGLGRRLAERVWHAAVHVWGQAGVLSTRGGGHRRQRGRHERQGGHFLQENIRKTNKDVLPVWCIVYKILT